MTKPPTKPILGQVSVPDIRLLRIFTTVVECGGFSAAEPELDIARSTISTHIAALERRLELRLCSRGRGGFALTEHGRLVYTEAMKLFAAMEVFRSHVNAVHRRLAGELVIAMVDNLLTLPEIELVEAIGRFHDRAPLVHISLRVLAADEIERGLLDGRVHAGVVALTRRKSGLDYRMVATERQQVYCGRGHPLYAKAAREVSAAEIRGCEFVGRTYFDEAKARGRPFRAPPTATGNNLEAILMLVLSGRYLGLLPVQYAERWEREGTLRALRPDLTSIEQRFALVTRRTRTPVPEVAAFLEAIGGFDSR